MRVKLVVTNQAKLYLVSCGYDREYGARQLKRIVTSKVEDRLSEEIIKGNVLEGETVTVDCQNDKLIFSSK
jgi:ATP-dependent Clp protease ATP-binding subunit ClpC